MLDLKPINKQTTVEQVVSRLREAIYTGKMPAGTKVTQNELSALLNVSVTPVREALMILNQERLVQLAPHKEAIILGINQKYIYDKYYMRAILEKSVIELIFNAPSFPDLTELYELHRETEKLIKQKKYSTYSERNKKFHQILWVAGGNDFITDVLTKQWVGYSIAKHMGIEENANQSFKEHKIIVEALEKRDCESACSAMFDHIIRSMHDILTHIDR